MNRLLLLGALALIFAACTGSIGGPDAPEGADGTSSTSRPPAELAYARPPKLDLDVLRLALVRPETYLPAEVSLADQSAVITADLLYDGLTEAAGLESRLRPGLAQSWVANDDFTQWTFTLDLRRIDAYRVADHFNQLATTDSISVTATLLLSDIVGVEAVSARDVRFTLARPNAGFAWLMSGLGASVVGPDGLPTGRYVIERDTEEALTLVPDLEVFAWPSIEIAWVESDHEGYETLTLGLVDGAVAPQGSLGDARSRFGMTPPARSISYFYGVAADSPRFDDPTALDALFQALDRATLAGDGRFVADGVVAPSMAGYAAAGCGSWCDIDPSATGRAEGLGDDPLPLTVSSDEQVASALMAAGQLEGIGFDVEVEQVPATEFADKIAGGGAELFAFGWIAGAGSVDAVVGPLFGSASPANVLGYRSVEIDGLLAQARLTGDDEARWALLNEVEQLAMGERRIVPVAVAKSQLVLAPHAGRTVVRADGSIDMEASQ